MEGPVEMLQNNKKIGYQQGIQIIFTFKENVLIQKTTKMQPQSMVFNMMMPSKLQEVIFATVISQKKLLGNDLKVVDVWHYQVDANQLMIDNILVDYEYLIMKIQRTEQSVVDYFYCGIERYEQNRIRIMFDKNIEMIKLFTSHKDIIKQQLVPRFKNIGYQPELISQAQAHLDYYYLIRQLYLNKFNNFSKDGLSFASYVFVLVKKIKHRQIKLKLEEDMFKKLGQQNTHGINNEKQKQKFGQEQIKIMIEKLQLFQPDITVVSTSVLKKQTLNQSFVDQILFEMSYFKNKIQEKLYCLIRLESLGMVCQFTKERPKIETQNQQIKQEFNFIIFVRQLALDYFSNIRFNLSTFMEEFRIKISKKPKISIFFTENMIAQKMKIKIKPQQFFTENPFQQTNQLFISTIQTKIKNTFGQIWQITQCWTFKTPPQQITLSSSFFYHQYLIFKAEGPNYQKDRNSFYFSVQKQNTTQALIAFDYDFNFLKDFKPKIKSKNQFVKRFDSNDKKPFQSKNLNLQFDFISLIKYIYERQIDIKQGKLENDADSETYCQAILLYLKNHLWNPKIYFINPEQIRNEQNQIIQLNLSPLKDHWKSKEYRINEIINHHIQMLGNGSIRNVWDLTTPLSQKQWTSYNFYLEYLILKIQLPSGSQIYQSLQRVDDAILIVLSDKLEYLRNNTLSINRQQGTISMKERYKTNYWKPNLSKFMNVKISYQKFLRSFFKQDLSDKKYGKLFDYSNSQGVCQELLKYLQ